MVYILHCYKVRPPKREKNWFINHLSEVISTITSSYPRTYLPKLVVIRPKSTTWGLPWYPLGSGLPELAAEVEVLQRQDHPEEQEFKREISGRGDVKLGSREL